MTWVWGVDTSSKAMDVGFHNTETLETTALTCHIAGPKDTFKGARSLQNVIERVSEWLAYLPTVYKPSIIVVESPYVSHGAQQQLMVYGAMLGAIACMEECVIHEVASSTWKASCGHGGADKRMVMEWARSMGYKGTRQDHADAICMTVHAQNLWTLAKQHGDV